MHTQTIDGLLLLDKPKGITSFSCIKKIKKLITVKKAGHAGTLDKNATGLLIIGLGKSTKLLKFIITQKKTYLAEIYFGIQTNTDDINGEIINKYEGDINIDIIKNYLPEFKGEIEQVPPDFSAVHVNGQRAYKLALQKNKPKLVKRKVTIYSNDIIDHKNNILKLKIECSSGTYIRSIARDLGLKTGYYAYLHNLRRIDIDNYSINDAYTLDDIENYNYKILPPVKILNFNKLIIDKEHSKMVKNGNRFNNEWIINKEEKIIENKFYKIIYNNNLIAIVKYYNGNFIYDLVY